MAAITIFYGRRMISGFTCGDNTIVAGTAGADDRRVVNPADMVEGDGVMAVFTCITTEDV